MEFTEYGYKQEGKTRFVIVAPHGAGDDLRTRAIARKLGSILNAYLVVNTVFFKPTNKRAKEFPERVEDFNKLRWGIISKKYFWGRKKKPMKLFYRDIASYCDKIIEYGQKPIVVYIHGFTSSEYAIDIGCGLKNFHETKVLVGANKHEESGVNSGNVTLRIKYLKKIKKLMEEIKINRKTVQVKLGREYPGWSRQSAIQFHKFGGRNDYAFQLEFSTPLRINTELRHYIVEEVAKILKKIFLNNKN